MDSGGFSRPLTVDLRKVGEEERKKRIEAGGGIIKMGREDRRMLGRELWGGM